MVRFLPLKKGVMACCPYSASFQPRRDVDNRPPGAILKHVLQQETPLDLMFHALADPSRRSMVDRLCRGPASVSELAEPLAMSLSAVVQHLQVLEASGLVRSEKAGRVRTCRIEPAALHTAERWIAARRATWERRLDRLGDYLAEQPGDATLKE
jgi:DNA-binding transcriptional ArsR family regulator